MNININLTLLLFIMTLFSKIQSTAIPKIIWLYWDTGFQNTRLCTKLCLENYRYYTKIDGWELRQLNATSVNVWLNQIPTFNGFQSVDEYYFWWRKQAKADLIRLTLLEHFGGVWMDANMIVSQRFIWIQNLKNDPNVDNKFGDEPNVVLFCFPDYGSTETAIIQKTNQKVLISPGYETWFIAAIPKAPLMTDWLAEFNSYLKHGFKFKDQKVAKNNIILRDLTKYQGYLTVSEALQVIIQMKQKQFDQKALQPRKFAVDQYKLWSINASVGPFKLFFEADRDYYLFANLLTKNQPMAQTPKYFIKLVGGTYKIMEDVINSPLCIGSNMDFNSSIIYHQLLERDGNLHNVKFCTFYMCKWCIYGFTTFLIVLIIALIISLGLYFWRCWKRYQYKKQQTQNKQQQKQLKAYSNLVESMEDHDK